MHEVYSSLIEEREYSTSTASVAVTLYMKVIQKNNILMIWNDQTILTGMTHNNKLQCVRNSLILSNKKRSNKNLSSTIKHQSAYVHIDDRLTGDESMDTSI
jgi:hypothetical protein